MRSSGNHPSTTTLEPGRLQLILQRLQEKFYESGPPSEEIARAVQADLKDLPPARSR